MMLRANNIKTKRRLAIGNKSQIPSYVAMLSELCLADISAVKPILLVCCGDMLQGQEWLDHIPSLS